MSSVLAGDRRISIAFVEVCAAVTVRSAQVVRVRTCSCQKIYDMGSSHMTCIMSTACVPSLFRIESCTMFAHACCGLRGSGAAQAIQWHTSDTPPRWTTRSSKLPACGNTAPHHSQKQQQYKSTECKPHCHEPGKQATQPEHAETALPCCSTAPTRSASHVSRRQAPLRQPGALHGCNRVPGGSGRGRALVQAQARTGSAPTACAMPPGRSRKNVDASCPRRPAVGATRRLLAQSTDGDLTATTRGLAVRAPGARGLTGRDRVHASTPGDSSRPRARAAPAAPCCWRASWPGTRGSRSRRPCRCQTSGSSSAPPAGRRQRPAAPFEAARQGLRKT